MRLSESDAIETADNEFPKQKRKTIEYARLFRTFQGRNEAFIPLTCVNAKNSTRRKILKKQRWLNQKNYLQSVLPYS